MPNQTQLPIDIDIDALQALAEEDLRQFAKNITGFGGKISLSALKKELVALIDMLRKAEAAQQEMQEQIKIGVIRRWPEGFSGRFHQVTKDLMSYGAITDLWLLDLSIVLKEAGVEMRLFAAPDSADSEGAKG